MAEIKSTMEMVLERAAKMAAESTRDTSLEDDNKLGMRLAAEYLKNSDENLLATLQEQKQDKQAAVLKGMAEALIRNIVLPRDEMLMETGERALKAIAEIAPSTVPPICTEIQQILSQYNQHKEQMQQQVEDAIRKQLEQKLAQEGGAAGENISVNPTMHPQYQEEMARMLSELNGQYNQALDERKNLILQHLVPTT
jgi:hypothetical protein